MGFRFRKSKKLGPVRLNLSKSGLGASVGVKGFRVTKTATGRVRTTASIPGTGISYVKETGGKRAAKSQQSSRSRKRIGCLPIFAVFLLLVVFGSIGGASSKRKAEPKPTVEVVAPASENLVTAVAITSKPEPTPKPTPEPTPEPTPKPSPTPIVMTYVANKNTGKFHKPNCASVDDMQNHNKAVFETTRDEMIAMGFEPCGRCHP